MFSRFLEKRRRCLIIRRTILATAELGLDHVGKRIPEGRRIRRQHHKTKQKHRQGGREKSTGYHAPLAKEQRNLVGLEDVTSSTTNDDGDANGTDGDRANNDGDWL
jgi:hypothetical protein